MKIKISLLDDFIAAVKSLSDDAFLYCWCPGQI
jgi:hypothetical protein